MNQYIVVCGDRDPSPQTLADVDRTFDFLVPFYGGTLRILEGGQRGVDRHARNICEARGVRFKTFPWVEGRGKGGGWARNREMAEFVADKIAEGHWGACYAFRGGRGTRSMMQCAEERSIHVETIPEDWHRQTPSGTPGGRGRDPGPDPNQAALFESV